MIANGFLGVMVWVCETDAGYGEVCVMTGYSEFWGFFSILNSYLFVLASVYLLCRVVLDPLVISLQVQF